MMCRVFYQTFFIDVLTAFWRYSLLFTATALAASIQKIRLSDGLGFLFALSLVTEAFLVDESDGTVNCSPVGGLQ